MSSDTKWELALTQEFQRSQLRLGHNHREAVQKTLLNLQKGLESPHLHKLEGSSFHSFGVNKDALRIICSKEGDLLVLLHVNTHDESYRWAERHRVLQVGSYIRILRTVTEEVVVDAPGTAADVAVPGPLHHVQDKAFRHFSITEGAASLLRQTPDENTLLELITLLQPAIGEALLGLSTDPGNLDQIVRLYQESLEQTHEAPTLAAAVHSHVNAENVWPVPSQDGALEKALQSDLESWRVFLHPSQKRLACRDDLQAYKVSGGPGTGKSVLALHRARELAETILADDPRPILLTTFSRVLTRDLRGSMERLCADNPALMQRIEIQTITQAAMALLAKSGQELTFFGDDVVSSCWDEAMKHESLGKSREFYISEREQIFARQGTWTGEAYAKARRAGRRSRLNRAARQKVWHVIESFEQAMAARGGGDNATLARLATAAIASGALTSPYAAIVCDELQDVGGSELRLLAALTQEEDSEETRPNGLFLVGDHYQSLYRAPVPLAQCGIRIQGRSSVLRCNYRTTEGIRQAAIEVVRQVDFAMEDESEEKTLDGYYSSRRGPRPEEHKFASAEAEADWLVKVIEDNQAWPFLILARTTSWLEKLRSRMQTRGVESKLLNSQNGLAVGDQVVMCTLHRSKGLEAPRVAIVGSQQIPRPWHGRGDESEKEIWEKQEKCLLYVGMTRARDWCALSHVN